ncbi:SDR family NAD(P)-dependent oxidoreductase [Egicoccus sp. AB-alg2]|uniref:SDR family NAD(P)-dependent oxidoreductase n=1 Tax=Egicoccus sp. AB-alg2 TaxID=3242693 RepID=UPI00359DF534
MTAPLAGRIAIVTGAGSGIGAATARRLAADGAAVILTGRRPAPLEAVAASCGGIAVVADVTEPGDWARVTATAQDRFGGADVLVANAGVEAFGSVESVRLDDWHAVQRTNVDGVLLGIRAVAPLLRRRGGGSIVVVSSVAGLTAGPDYAAYVTSKTAVLGLVRSAAVDLGPDRIRVNALCPGWTRTEMSERETAAIAAEQGTTAEALWTRLVAPLPLGRAADPDEIAACVRFLAGPESSFVTGSTLVADGGGGAVDVGTLGSPVERGGLRDPSVPNGDGHRWRR